MKLIIGDYNYSSWSMRPWMFIKYHQLDVDVERLMFESDELAQRLDGLFSNGKVPVLIDDDLEILMNSGRPYNAQYYMLSSK